MAPFGSRTPEKLVVDPRAIGILIDGNKDASLQKQIADALAKVALEATKAGNTQVASEAVRKLGEIGTVNATISNCSFGDIG